MADAAADADEKMATERIGRVLGGRWTLERLIGVGGMAAVYSARGNGHERAALKVLHPEMSRRSDIRQRFAQEGLAAMRVGHPGVVSVLGSGEEPDGTAFLALELLDGEPLGARLQRQGSLPLPELLAIVDQVLDVLAAAHEHGIVHRDLKPDNLFITSDKRVKVLDFGIARVLDDVPGAYKTRTGITLGTVPFMSPEQALGKRAQVDGRSDLFSLGAMMFRILSGRHVHSAETDAELLVAMASKPAPPLASVAPSCPPGLCAVVDLALAFAKDSRYPSARVMQEDLRAVKAGKAPPHANRVRAAREMATRTDLPTPSISVAVNRAVATMPDRAAARPDAPAVTAPSPLSSATVAEPPAFTIPDTAPPASFRGAALPSPEAAVAAAPTVENPAYAAPTIRMARAPDARTLTSEPPVARATWVRPAIVGAVVLATVLGGGYLVLSRAASESAPPAVSSSDPASATPADVPAVPSAPAAAAPATENRPAPVERTPLPNAHPAFPPRPPTPVPAPTNTAAAATPAAAIPAPPEPSPTSTVTPAPSPTGAAPNPGPAPAPAPTTTPRTLPPPAPAPSPNQPKGWSHGHKVH